MLLECNATTPHVTPVTAAPHHMYRPRDPARPHSPPGPAAPLDRFGAPLDPPADRPPSPRPYTPRRREDGLLNHRLRAERARPRLHGVGGSDRARRHRRVAVPGSDLDHQRRQDRLADPRRAEAAPRAGRRAAGRRAHRQRGVAWTEGRVGGSAQSRARGLAPNACISPASRRSLPQPVHLIADRSTRGACRSASLKPYLSDSVEKRAAGRGSSIIRQASIRSQRHGSNRSVISASLRVSATAYR